MKTQEIPMPPHHQIIMNRFIAACQTDKRVVAAFLGGSYASGTADAYSDLDLYLITTDAMYDDLKASYETFLRLLGEPLFLQNFDDFGFDLLVFTLADGTEGELALGRESHFSHIHGGPYRTLLDKKGTLSGVVFPWYEPPHATQIETLHGLIYWFWHDLSHHFIKSLARGQLWSAYGALEDLRRTCINLARLRQNFSMVAEGYEKVEQVLPAEQLSALQATFCPMERQAMLRAALIIVGFYRDMAPALAQAYGIPYPAELARVVFKRLERLCQDYHILLP